MSFVSFPSIENFHNVVKSISVYPHLAPTPIKYRGKIKLHGTNAGVRIYNGEVTAQSRTQTISAKADNAGFAQWVDSRAEYFRTIQEKSLTIFGEWAGSGIMKGTAINQIPGRIFAVFAVFRGDTTEEQVVMTEPTEIRKILGDLPTDIHILPWHGDEFTVNFSDRENLQATVDRLNKVVEEIEPCDPWVKEVFGIDGTAEGVVYVPQGGGVVTRKTYSDLSFKAKGEKHKVVKTKQAVQIDPEVAESIGGFVNQYATEARFEQGLATGISTEMKNIPAFLKWVGQDVHKESADELAASGLEWSKVEKSVQAAARNWFILKCKAI